MAFASAAIVGATGATGIHLAAALRAENKTVRVVGRSPERLSKAFPSDEIGKATADALDADAVLKAVDGVDVVFDCIGLPGARMHHHPATARNVAAAVSARGANCVHVSSYWAYSPLQRGTVGEDHPRSGGSPWMRYRRKAEDILLDAGAAVLHLPDFYGAHVGFSTLNAAIKDAAGGGAINWIGGANIPRDYIYVPDAMNIAVAIADRDEAYRNHWALPGTGPITAAEIAEMIGRALGRNVKVRSPAPVLLRALIGIVGMFDQTARGFGQMVPEYLKPVTYDAGRLEKLIGNPRLTPYETGIAATLEWINSSR